MMMAGEPGSQKDVSESASASRDPQSVSWWMPDDELTDVNPAARQILEQHSGVAPDEVVSHVLCVRQRAFSVCPYPCIGQFRFLELSISKHPKYDEVVALMKQERIGGDGDSGGGAEPAGHVPALLDVGCCFGQDLRKLAFDGVPADRLAGAELEPAFVDLGYDLFRDRATLGARLLGGADIFDDSPSSPFAALAGGFDVVHAASLLHLFDWPTSVRAAARLVRLLRPRPGAMILGRQVSRPSRAGEVPDKVHADPANPGKTVFLHDADSFRAMWLEVGRLTGSAWRVTTSFATREGNAWKTIPGSDESALMTFDVVRTS